MAHHNSYWSCSKFADWLRGTKKLDAGTSEQWDEWTNMAKMRHSFRYWLAEEGLSYLQDFITWPIRKLYDIKYYINNRFITRTHSLTAHSRDIRPGSWCDVGNRFLPCLFNELVDFVEIEQAWHHCLWDDDAKSKFNPPWYSRGWFRWRTWRCAEAGLEYLRWASSLTMGQDWGVEESDSNYGKPTYQAKAAKEIIELYTWWTEVYPNRPDPYDASGWTDYCERMRVKYPGSFMSSLNTKDKEERRESDRAHKLLRKIEKQYEDEDEKMMIRLVKIRNSLWT